MRGIVISAFHPVSVFACGEATVTVTCACEDGHHGVDSTIPAPRCVHVQGPHRTSGSLYDAMADMRPIDTKRFDIYRPAQARRPRIAPTARAQSPKAKKGRP